jgi:hypothetical protein
MDALAALYRLKPESVGEPTRYLGANVGKHTLPNGREVWMMSSHDYIKSAVKNVEADLKETGGGLPNNARATERPYPVSYRPEVDISPALDDRQGNKYQNLIGVLRWAIELGRIDIYTEVSMLSSHLCAPREGHLEAVYSIFAYLKKHDRSKVVFDDSCVDQDERLFPKYDWVDFYGDISEELPPNMPKSRGQPVKMTCWVDADHAGNLVTRRSHTGVLVFLNNAPIQWLSKRQNTVEASTFGSEFNAMRIATEVIEGLRYKLRMFGIPIEEATDVFCDNQGVVSNTSLPHSTLAKKHNAICYHRVREAVARGTIRIAKIDGTMNLADVFTKTTISTVNRKRLFGSILY